MSAQSIDGIIIAKRIINPPIVGVPALEE